MPTPQPDLSPAGVLHDLAVEVRTKTLLILDWARPAELTWTPPGTSNHVLWHSGHALWVQDALCLHVLTGKSELPAGWRERFGMGSRPALQRQPWPSAQEVRQCLEAQLPRWCEAIKPLTVADLESRPPFAHPQDTRTLRECIAHGIHDEANHQGEMYLLLKMQRLGGGRA